MELIKPKFNIGDQIFVISKKVNNHKDYCKECGHYKGTIEDDTYYYNSGSLFTISGILCDFEEETVFYNLAFKVEDEYQETKWDSTYYYNVPESDIFKNYFEIKKECERRNKI